MPARIPVLNSGTHGNTDPMRTLVGRSAELAGIDRALDEARSGHGRLLLISGPAGIGKSRLAEAAISAAEVRAMAVARGYAIDDAGAPPLWPWLRALRGRPGVDALPAVDADDSDAAARFGLFGAITELLHADAAPAGLLVVLEDLHWADRTSLLLLRHVAAEIGVVAPGRSCHLSRRGRGVASRCWPTSSGATRRWRCRWRACPRQTSRRGCRC